MLAAVILTIFGIDPLVGKQCKLKFVGAALKGALLFTELSLLEIVRNDLILRLDALNLGTLTAFEEVCIDRMVNSA